jgi:hypothetical protein
MVFLPKSTNLGKFWRAWEWKMLLYILVMWNILRTIGYIFLAFGNCVVIGYIFSPLWYFVPRKIWQPWSERRLPLNFRYEKTFLGSLFRAHKKAATFFSQKKNSGEKNGQLFVRLQCLLWDNFNAHGCLATGGLFSLSGL